MKRFVASILACFGCLALGADAPQPASPAAPLPPAASRHIDFIKDIKPLFESSCIQCHAKGKDKGGFSLETRDAVLKGGDDGPAVVPGKSGQSSMVQMVAGVDPDNVMPKKGTRWTREQVGLLRAWIDQGMQWDASITFARPEPRNLKPVVVAVPTGADNPLDRLVNDYFHAKGIAAPAPVEDRVFCRRAYLDAIGLLPSPDQLNAFLADPSADKRAGLVRELLADRRGYADHWLTFWNDLLRNDYRGAGFIDGGRRQITGWLYASLIENKPYDRFVAELVDPNKQCEGFSRGIIWRGSVNAAMQPPLQAAQNISQVFLGVNLKCASCHDSFVSDWTLADAYGLAAVYSDSPLELVQCDKPLGKKVAPRFLYPQIGTLDPNASKEQRLARLASLMTDKSNARLPLTIVNRLWGKLLGRALVEPVDDMEKPAWDADILNWLADDLVAHKYDLKHTIEVILTSRAYQLPTVDVPAGKDEYVFRGPLARRLTAEQYCDAISSFTDDFARFPATQDVDFTAGNLVGPMKMPAWVWTDEPVEAGQKRAAEQAAKPKKAVVKRNEDQKAKADEVTVTANADKKPVDAKAEAPAAPDKMPKDKDDADDAARTEPPVAEKPSVPAPPTRHRVIFRKQLKLDAKPHAAYAALGTSQAAGLVINGKVMKPIMADGQLNGRVAVFDLGKALLAGDNVIVIDVSSHTEKKMNDVERQQFPGSLNHLNKVSGVGFYLRIEQEEKRFTEITTDDTWRVRRSPDGKVRDVKFDDSDWEMATPLPAGVQPVDEGPALQPIARQDFSIEPIELAIPMRCAAATAIQPGGIRASLLAADPLMTALDRPNREQVMTVRQNGAATLQALELTNGKALDGRLQKAAKAMLPAAQKDKAGWIRATYLRSLGREPSMAEDEIAADLLGDPVSAPAIADFLWAITELPEFQFVN
jgi:mono/diheme cytochrome c family protein